MNIFETFRRFFDDSEYRPHPISLEGMDAYQKQVPKIKCPYTDPEKKSYWEHGWNVTDIGYMKAAQFSGEDYEDPKDWN